jgi:hypothetical protein
MYSAYVYNIKDQIEPEMRRIFHFARLRVCKTDSSSIYFSFDFGDYHFHKMLMDEVMALAERFNCEVHYNMGCERDGFYVKFTFYPK